ncbi:MAG: hypothetical protein ACRDH5_15410 [bacterium]
MRPKTILKVPGAVSLTRPQVVPEGRYTYPPEPPFVRRIPHPWRQQILLEQGFFEQAGRLVERFVQRPAQKIIRYLAPAAGVQVVPYPVMVPTVPTGPSIPTAPPRYGAEPGAEVMPWWVWPAAIGGGVLVLVMTMGGFGGRR